MVKAPVGSDDRIAECRELIRNFRAPHRLGQNSLARAILERLSTSERTDVALGAAVETALDLLPSRDRAIVRRCEIDREVFSLVAAELSISERHLYRERQRVLKSLVDLLLTPRSISMDLRTDASDALTRLVRTSRTLEENGSVPAATEIIEKQAIACAGPFDRSRLLLRLAELHGRAGAFARAMECLSSSIEHARQSSDAHPTLQAEISVTRATIAHQCGEPVGSVLKDLHRAIELIRKTGGSRLNAILATTLSRALALRVEASIFSGNLTETADAARELAEAQTLLAEPDPETRVLILSAHSLSKVFCESDIEGAARYRWQAIDIADNAGLTLSSLGLAVDLASLYRLRNDSKQAIAMLSARLPTARAIANGPVLAALLIELAGAFVDCQMYDRARVTLDDAIALINSHDGLRAAWLRQSAGISLRIGEIASSYEHAAAAEDAYVGLGKQRLAAASQRLQAEALFSSGQRRAALRKIHGAIDVLSSLHQRNSLAAAYAVLWKISGNFKHLEQARKLTGAGGSADVRSLVRIPSK